MEKEENLSMMERLKKLRAEKDGRSKPKTEAQLKALEKGREIAKTNFKEKRKQKLETELSELEKPEKPEEPPKVEEVPENIETYEEPPHTPSPPPKKIIQRQKPEPIPNTEDIYKKLQDKINQLEEEIKKPKRKPLTEYYEDDDEPPKPRRKPIRKYSEEEEEPPKQKGLYLSVDEFERLVSKYKAPAMQSMPSEDLHTIRAREFLSKYRR